MGSKIRGVPEAAPLKPNSDTSGESALEARATTANPVGSRAAKSSGHDDRTFSVGRYLAQQRSLRSISIEDLAEITKIPQRSLERLEAGVFDHHPDGFARGFVRTVAGALGLDPNEAVMRLLREPPDDEAETRRHPGLRVFTAAALVLLGLGVIGVMLWGSTATLRSNPVDGKQSRAIVLRRDVVRELAREQDRLFVRPSPRAGAVQADSVGSSERRR